MGYLENAKDNLAQAEFDQELMTPTVRLQIAQVQATLAMVEAIEGLEFQIQMKRDD